MHCVARVHACLDATSFVAIGIAYLRKSIGTKHRIKERVDVVLDALDQQAGAFSHRRLQRVWKQGAIGIHAA